LRENIRKAALAASERASQEDPSVAMRPVSQDDTPLRIAHWTLRIPYCLIDFPRGIIEARAVKISALQQQCANHPDRAASALCVDCRRSICQECATQWDGINYCVHCLARRGRGVHQQRHPMGWVFLSLFAVFFFWLAVRTMLWVGGLITSLF
jgi:hypothetical protein